MARLPVLDRLLGLARRNGELQQTEPASESDFLAAALAELAGERAAAESAVTAAAEEREKLLLEPGSDPRIDELDREIERAQRKIERCDRIEPLLLAQLRNRRDTLRQQHFTLLAETYKAAVARYCATLRDLLAIKREIVSLRTAGEQHGFTEARICFELPYIQCSDPDRFEFGTSQNLASMRAPSLQRELISVRFTKHCGIFQTGDVAGFEPDEADQYVAAGLAERAA